MKKQSIVEAWPNKTRVEFTGFSLVSLRGHPMTLLKASQALAFMSAVRFCPSRRHSIFGYICFWFNSSLFYTTLVLGGDAVETSIIGDYSLLSAASRTSGSVSR